jgi:exopolysaccharide/PEP-CTERM locus tyrosine autokinase
VSLIERAASRILRIESLESSSPVSKETPHAASIPHLDRALTKPLLLESSQTSDPDLLLDAVERAVNESAERLGRVEPGDWGPPSEGVPVAEPSSGTPLPGKPANGLLRLNRALLRRQSLLTPDDTSTSNFESFRHIKRQLLANVKNPKSDAPANLIVVTSALAGEGKTFCAINLAISIALEKNHTVLLVDADVAKPGLPQALGFEGRHGLMDMLLDSKVRVQEVLWRTDIERLSIIAAGASHKHATELFASDATRILLQEMALRYPDRVVIFDAPPLLDASEASALAAHMGQIVMVVEAGRTPEAAVRSALERVDVARVTGLILNKGQIQGRSYGYGGHA